MEMSPRERVRTALARRVPDRVPREMGFTPPVMELFRERTGADDPAEYFDFEVRVVSIRPTRRKADFSPYLGDLPPGTEVDEWGQAKAPGSMYHFTRRIHPMRRMRSWKELESYPFPDVTADYRFEGLAEEVQAWHERGYAVKAGGPGLSIFETSWAMRGLDLLLTDFKLNRDFAAALLDRVTEIGVEVASRLCRAGVDVLVTGDDVGMQDRMMMSPATWREWLKPRLARIFAAAKEANPDTFLFYHSDGYIEPIIPDLIEIGLEVLNPVQPECMDPAKLKREYGDQLAFWGTVGTQTTMPFGTPEQVKQVVRERIATVGRGGGLLLAPTHVLEPEVPWENILAFIEATNEFRYHRGSGGSRTSSRP